MTDDWRHLPPPARPIAAAADAAVAGLTPAGDMHASAATRTDVARVHVRRALELAVSRAQDRR